MTSARTSPLTPDPEAILPPPSPRAAVLGILLVLAAVFIAATRVVGAITPLEIDLFKTAGGWQVAPDPEAAKVLPAKTREDALECSFRAPSALGEELYMEIAYVGKEGRTLLPGAPIRPGWNQVLLEPASQFLAVRLRNTLFRWEQPGIAIVRGGPSRAPSPPEPLPVAVAILVALGAALLLGQASGGDALRDVGFVILLVASATVVANEQSPYRVFVSGETATLVALVPALLAYVAGRLRRRRAVRKRGAATALPSMGGARY
jgi:hypothetical protein